MKKGLIYFALFVLSVYFSFVVGGVLGDWEGDQSGSYAYEQQPGFMQAPSKGIEEYLNPFNSFSMLIPNSIGGGSEASSEEGVRRSSQSSYAPQASGGGTSSIFSERSENISSGGGNGGGSVVHVQGGRRKKAEENLLGGQGLNPFGGLLAQVTAANHQIAMARGTGTSPVGTIGLRLGNNVKTQDDDGPIPTPTPIPLDSGSLAMLLCCLSLGTYFIFRKGSKLEEQQA